MRMNISATGFIGIIIGLINPDTLSDFDGFENQLSMAMKYIKIVSFTFCWLITYFNT